MQKAPELVHESRAFTKGGLYYMTELLERCIILATCMTSGYLVIDGCISSCTNQDLHKT